MTTEFTQTTIKTTKTLFEKGDAQEISFTDCTIKKSNSTFEIYDASDTLVFQITSLNELSNTIMGFSNLLEFISKFNVDFCEDYNNWSYDEDRSSDSTPTWCSPYTFTTVNIAPNRTYSKWNVTISHKDSDIIYEKTHENYRTAFLNLIHYIATHNAYKIDYEKKHRKVAREELQELTGIGRMKAKNLIRDYNIKTFEELVERHFILGNDKYKDDIISEAKERVEKGDEITDHEELQEIRTKVTLENL